MADVTQKDAPKLSDGAVETASASASQSMGALQGESPNPSPSPSNGAANGTYAGDDALDGTNRGNGPTTSAPDTGRGPVDGLNAPSSPVDGPSAGNGTVDVEGLGHQVLETLKTVYDPEIPVNIYELGLIYTIDVNPEGVVDVKMTLTAPGCPVAFSMPGEIEDKIRTIPGVAEAHVQVVWEPPWNKDMMSEAAKLQLGFW